MSWLWPTNSSRRRGRLTVGAKRRREDLLGALALGRGKQRLDFKRRKPELEQALAGDLSWRGLAGAPRDDRLSHALADLLTQLDDDPLRGALAEPRHCLEARDIPRRNRRVELTRATAAEHRDRDLRSDRLHAEQEQEELALLLAREPVERHLAADRRHRRQRRCGDRELVADAAAQHHDAVGAA